MGDKLSLFLTRLEDSIKVSLSRFKPLCLKLFGFLIKSVKSSRYYLTRAQQDIIIPLLLLIIALGALTFYTIPLVPSKMGDLGYSQGVETPSGQGNNGQQGGSLIGDAIPNKDNSKPVKDSVGLHKNSVVGSEHKSTEASKIEDNSFKSGAYGVEFSFNDKLKAEVGNKDSGFHQGITSTVYSEKTVLSNFVGIDYSISVYVLPFVYDVNTMSAQNAGGIRVIDSSIQDYLVTNITRDCPEDDLSVYLGAVSLTNKNGLMSAIEVSYVSEGKTYLVYALPYVNNFFCVQGMTSVGDNKSLVKDMKEIIQTLDLTM